jgi:hypothetical protein
MEKSYVSLNLTLDLYNTGNAALGHVLTRLCFVRTVHEKYCVKRWFDEQTQTSVSGSEINRRLDKNSALQTET